MPKQKTILSTELLMEIRTYLQTYPNEPMEKVREHFKLGRKLFSRIVKNELNMWSPKTRNQQNWPPFLFDQIKLAFEENPTTIVEAHKIFLTQYRGERPVSFGTFRYFAQNLGLITKVKRKPVLFSQTDFQKVFNDYSKQTDLSPPKKVLRRTFFRFLKEVQNRPELFELDPTLANELKFCYRSLGKKMCWTCGKREHFGVFVPLELDHISGQCFDHRLSNLRLLCPCCHRLAVTTNRGYKATKKDFTVYENLNPNLDIETMKENRKKSFEELTNHF